MRKPGLEGEQAPADGQRRGWTHELPTENWPSVDRKLMAAAFAPGATLLDDDGCASHLADDTKHHRQRIWGRFLSFLGETGRLNSEDHPRQRLSRENATMFLQHIKVGVGASWVRQTMLELSLIGPWWDQNQDWKWLRRLPGVPSHREARASRREPRTFDPAHLSGAICAEVDGLRGRELSRDDQLWARDLAIMSIGLHATLRPRNLYGCRPGETVYVRDASVRLAFPEKETKTKRPILTELPPQSAAVVRFYIDRVRPSLMSGRPDHSALWVTFLGAPLGKAQMADACRRVGLRLIGQPTNPNSTRHSFATWMRRSSPTNLQAVATGLGHSTTRTMLRAYDRSGDLPACAAWKKLKCRVGRA